MAIHKFINFLAQRGHVFQYANMNWSILSRWWFQIFFIFTPKFGEDSQFDKYFSDGLVQPPTSFVFYQPWESFHFPILGFDSVYFSRVLLNIQKPPVCVWVPGWFLGKLYFLVIPSFTHNNGVITTGEAFESYFVGHRGGAWVTIRPGLGHFWRSQKEEWRYRGSWCGRELQMLRVMIFVDLFLTFWLFCVFETCYYVILCWLIWNMIS